MESKVNRRALRRRAYAMKKHRATRLHYDLRLEWNGVLLSWALPEGPSCRAGVLREAIEMEDHRVANLLFEGVHETGPIMLWDRGTWEPYPEFEDIESCLRNGILRFALYGEKLKGGWMLARTNRNASRTVWTVAKLADRFIESTPDKSILRNSQTASNQGGPWKRSFAIGQHPKINARGRQGSSTKHKTAKASSRSANPPAPRQHGRTTRLPLAL